MKRKASRQYRVLAVVWSFAAISMLAGVIRQLPNINAFGFAILALSVAAAAIWWTAYLRASKAEKPYQPKKDSEEKKHER